MTEPKSLESKILPMDFRSNFDLLEMIPIFGAGRAIHKAIQGKAGIVNYAYKGNGESIVDLFARRFAGYAYPIEQIASTGIVLVGTDALYRLF